MPDLRPTLHHEEQLWAAGYRSVAGVDEAGRGSLAGPVVAAAVVLPGQVDSHPWLGDLRDSKQLSPAQRERLFALILAECPRVGVGWLSSHGIDRLGISRANRRAFLRAITALETPPDALLLDHFPLPESPLPQLAVTHGDALCLSIAAASIVAKVVRDRWMSRCDRRYPGYGFAAHKGYGTSRHRAALGELGPSRIHRRTFSPVAQLPLWPAV